MPIVDADVDAGQSPRGKRFGVGLFAEVHSCPEVHTAKQAACIHPSTSYPDAPRGGRYRLFPGFKWLEGDGSAEELIDASAVAKKFPP